jgi:hypothetical protein
MTSIRSAIAFSVILAAAAAAAAPAAESASSPVGTPASGLDAVHRFDLVTASEAADWNKPHPEQPAGLNTRDLGEDVVNCHSPSDNQADNPQIRIISPPLGRPLSDPLDIDVQFVPTSSAPIRPESFRVCYVGFVTMDITRRITDHVTVTEHGVRVSGAQLPQGRHHLLLLIADQRGRVGRRDAVLDIE